MNRIIQIAILSMFTIAIANAQNIYVKNFIGFGTTSAGFVNGDSTVAKLNKPFGITTDKDGNIYIAENGNNCIRMITPQGVVSVFAGTGTAGYQDGPAASAKFNAPTGLCLDDSGNVYVSDFQNHRIRKITKATMMVSTISGSGIAGYKDSFYKDSVQFNYPRGICMDSKGNLYVGDSWNHRIRIVYQGDGSAATIAGGGNIFGVQSVSEFKDGQDTSARFFTPCEVKIDSMNNIYVADAYNHRIRKIDINKNVTTVCGSGPSGSANGGYADGSANTSRFNTPTTLYVSADGSLIYVGDGANNRVRKIEAGMVTSIAGTGSTGFSDGPGNVATFNFPRGIAVSPANDKLLYVVDYNNNAVRKIYLDYPLGINDIKGNELRYSLYPNPSKGSFNLLLPNGLESVNVCILNMIGTQLFSQTITSSSETTINSGLSTGIYLIELSGKGFKTIQKLIIE